jgi:HK97 family phage prohead protease
MGAFIERICKGAFSKALERNDNVRILLNHDHDRDLGGQKDGNLDLCEDSIGLHARATITDPEVVSLARDGKLVGWSFGFYDREVDCHVDEDGFPLRDVRDLDLEEVSLLDSDHTPAYDGTLVAVRSDESCMMFGETFADEINVREDETQVEEREETKESPDDVPKQQETVDEIPNYDEWDSLIKDMKS